VPVRPSAFFGLSTKVGSKKRFRPSRLTTQCVSHSRRDGAHTVRSVTGPGVRCGQRSANHRFYRYRPMQHASDAMQLIAILSPFLYPV